MALHVLSFMPYEMLSGELPFKLIVDLRRVKKETELKETLPERVRAHESRKRECVLLATRDQTPAPAFNGQG